MSDFALFFTNLLTLKTEDQPQIVNHFLLSLSKRSQVRTFTFLAGQAQAKIIASTTLKKYFYEGVDHLFLDFPHLKMESWLIDESFNQVKDIGDTIALLMGNFTTREKISLEQFFSLIDELQATEKDGLAASIWKQWKRLDSETCYVFNQVITGSRKFVLLRKMMVQILSLMFDVDSELIELRYPHTFNFLEVDSLEDFVKQKNKTDSLLLSRPFEKVQKLKSVADFFSFESGDNWQAEWQWHGLNVQMIFHKGVDGKTFLIWNKEMELVQKLFPEFDNVKEIASQSFIIEGQLLPMQKGVPMDFKKFEKRMSTSKPTKKVLDEIPFYFIATDLLGIGAALELGQAGLRRRQILLEEIVNSLGHDRILVTEIMEIESTEGVIGLLDESLERHVGGINLRRVDGLREGEGNHFEVEARRQRMEVVLMYVGRATSAYAKGVYTFGVEQGGEWVPVATIKESLDAGIERKIVAYMEGNVVEKFGPIRRVRPGLFFEISYAARAVNSRKKCGYELKDVEVIEVVSDNSKKT